MLIEPFIFAVAAAMAITVSYGVAMFLAQARQMLDQPNERSSHTHATPRTGGVAIMAGWVAGCFVITAFAGDAGAALRLAMIGLCAASAFALGLADDRIGLSALWKLVGQIVVAALFVVLFGPLTAIPLPFFGEVTLAPLWGVLLAILWIVGFMNAFNFMDGANGLAGGAAAAGLAWFSVAASFAGAPVLAVAALLLALAAAGFLPENLVRGKLFMGDNGSLALGFLIAAFAVLGVNWTQGRLSALVAPVIFLPFLFDAAWTLVLRLVRGRNIFQAHREHCYQLLIRSGVSHARVAILYMALISLSAAAAVLMLAMPPSLQWLAPLLLALIFSCGATAIYVHADRAGFFPTAQKDAAVQAAE